MVTRARKASIYEQAQREHELLHQKLKYLNHQLAKRQIPLREIVELLDGLRGFFIAHFQKEERDGLFELIVARAPHLSRQASKLSHEHFELVERLDGLIRFARRGTGQPLCWWMLGLRMQDFTKKLQLHEAEENGLLQMAYADDLGTKD